ncbi:predicted protein [Chaetoceros tenuissimus]|uniref:HTH myb-type domain-containing protein n=1 Tax=Chaetoceros tenuissimus TaxID=426638 RepID=A0AAD3D6Z0_9STRA|nr:predicted protein [Chaetoceros tenuissimus]
MFPTELMKRYNLALHEYIHHPARKETQQALREVIFMVDTSNDESFPTAKDDDSYSRMKIQRAVEMAEINKKHQLTDRTLSLLLERLVDVQATIGKKHGDITENSIGVGCSKKMDKILELFARARTNELFEVLIFRMIEIELNRETGLFEEDSEQQGEEQGGQGSKKGVQKDSNTEETAEAIQMILDDLQDLHPQTLTKTLEGIEEKIFETNAYGDKVLKKSFKTIVKEVLDKIPKKDFIKQYQFSLKGLERWIMAAPEPLPCKRKHLDLDAGDFCVGLFTPEPVKKRRRNKKKVGVFEAMLAACKDSTGLTFNKMKEKNPELKQYSNEVLRDFARTRDEDNSQLQRKIGAKKKKWTEDEEEILIEAVYKLNDTSPAKIERLCGNRLKRNQHQIKDKLKLLMAVGKIDIAIQWEDAENSS